MDPPWPLPASRGTRVPWLRAAPPSAQPGNFQCVSLSDPDAPSSLFSGRLCGPGSSSAAPFLQHLTQSHPRPSPPLPSLFRPSGDPRDL